MKTNIVGIVAVATVVAMLSGCGPAPVAPATDQSSSATSVEGGVADWVSGLASGKRMQCIYEMGGTSDRSLSVKMFADKSRYRTETATPAGTMISLSDGVAMYTWTVGTKQGVKMDFECAKGLQGGLSKDTSGTTQPGQSSYPSPQDAVRNIPNISCSEAVDPVDFSVPSDVAFVDQCALLKSSLDAAKNVQGRIPDSVKNSVSKN